MVAHPICLDFHSYFYSLNRVDALRCALKRRVQAAPIGLVDQTRHYIFEGQEVTSEQETCETPPELEG